jgi:hypothetical protein
VAFCDCSKAHGHPASRVSSECCSRWILHDLAS